MTLAMAYAAGIQKLIYSRGPCYSRPLSCGAALVPTEGNQIEHRPNEVSIWAQIPVHILVAASEIFGFVALNEFAYAEASTNMKALVKAFEQFTAALGAALGMALGPVSKDPWLMAMYIALSGAMALSGAAFFAVFRSIDKHWHADKAVEDLETSVEAGIISEKDKGSIFGITRLRMSWYVRLERLLVVQSSLPRSKNSRGLGMNN
jgi:hypothetical protein